VYQVAVAVLQKVTANAWKSGVGVFIAIFGWLKCRSQLDLCLWLHHSAKEKPLVTSCCDCAVGLRL
jgi:hypothetical protein